MMSKKKNFLSIPVYSDSQIVAVVGAANKEIDYNEEDVLNLELLMNTVWSQVERKKSEEALAQSFEEIFTSESNIIIHEAISKGINDLIKNPESSNSYSTELQQICKKGIK